jgi:DNA-directed RNA polymerase specialized sigma24 family protein
MQFHWTFSGCDDAQEARVARLWESRQAGLEAKSNGMGGELWIAVEHSPTESPAWVLRSTLVADADTFASEQASDELAGALDQVVADLSRQIEESEGRPAPARRHIRRHARDATPILDSFYRERRSGPFFSLLMPLVQSLARYVRRELSTRRLLGETQHLTVRDVLDEVLLQAWNEFARRPQNLGLDLWLIQLIDRVLEVGGRTIAEESLDEERPEPSTDPQETRRDEWIDLPIDEETLELASLLPGAGGIESWDDLEVEAKQAHLDEIFGRLTRSQRQVVMLHAVEGYEIAVIADFQNRPQAEVDDDLAAARTILQRMANDVELPEIEEQLEQSAIRKSGRAQRG